MPVYSEKRSYNTKAHLGMIEITDHFNETLAAAYDKHGILNGTITGFTTGGVAAITTLEWEPGIVKYDLREALDKLAPYLNEAGQVIHYKHHDTWNDDNGSSHVKSALLSPFVTVPVIDGQMTLGPWQNLVLVECDVRDRHREVVYQVMGE